MSNGDRTREACGAHNAAAARAASSCEPTGVLPKLSIRNFGNGKAVSSARDMPTKSDSRYVHDDTSSTSSDVRARKMANNAPSRNGQPASRKCVSFPRHSSRTNAAKTSASARVSDKSSAESRAAAGMDMRQANRPCAVNIEQPAKDNDCNRGQPESGRQACPAAAEASKRNAEPCKSRWTSDSVKRGKFRNSAQFDSTKCVNAGGAAATPAPAEPPWQETARSVNFAEPWYCGKSSIPVRTEPSTEVHTSPAVPALLRVDAATALPTPPRRPSVPAAKRRRRAGKQLPALPAPWNAWFVKRGISNMSKNSSSGQATNNFRTATSLNALHPRNKRACNRTPTPAPEPGALSPAITFESLAAALHVNAA
mmetsp:Transcript_112001/g.321862  ORF Transcript_112001/g.321862 Transcript_112001/m.321862 type:complete len:368 (-) Transcript_112001:1039-2142(-)